MRSVGMGSHVLVGWATLPLAFVLAVPAGAQQGKATSRPATKPAAERQLSVLLLASRPLWEFRYLRTMLKRMGSSVKADAVLVIPGDKASSRSLPRTKKQFQKYDVALLIGLSADALGKDKKDRAAWYTMLDGYVRGGGGVAFVCDGRAMPESHQGSKLEGLFPVTPLAADKRTRLKLRTDAFRPVPTRTRGKIHPIARLTKDLGQNQKLWTEGIGEMFFCYPVIPKPRARAILRHPHATDPLAVATVSKIDKGRVMFLATDETWHWRKHRGESVHSKFWQNSIRYLAQSDGSRK